MPTGSFPRAATLDPATGYLWTSDYESDEIVAYDHAGNSKLTFGVSGSGSGQLSIAQAIAIADGEAYVAEAGNNRIQVFDTQGNHLRMWGTAGSGAGQFAEPCGVVVVGNFVYVADAANDRIQVFTSAGGFVNEFGSTGAGDGQLSLACSGSYLAHHNGEIFVIDLGNNRIAVFDLDGNWERNFGTLSGAHGIAADDKGQIWVVEASAHRVSVWSTIGVPIGDFGGLGSTIGGLSLPTGIAIDPTGATAWVHEQGNKRTQVFTTLKCDGELLTHVATSYADKLTTGGDDDVVHLGKGLDTASTKGGSDTVCGGPGGDTIRTDGFRFSEYTGAKGQFQACMLYDHRADPDEDVNIAGRAKSKSTVEALTKRLHEGMGKDRN